MSADHATAHTSYRVMLLLLLPLLLCGCPGLTELQGSLLGQLSSENLQVNLEVVNQNENINTNTNDNASDADAEDDNAGNEPPPADDAGPADDANDSPDGGWDQPADEDNDLPDGEDDEPDSGDDEPAAVSEGDSEVEEDEPTDVGPANPQILATEADYHLYGDQLDEQLGVEVAACDFNGDGIDDLVVKQGGDTIVRIFAGPIGSHLTKADAFATIDATAVDGCGHRVAGMKAGGDINGDGRDDIAFYSAPCETGLYIVLGTVWPEDFVLTRVDGEWGGMPAPGTLHVDCRTPWMTPERIAITNINGDGQDDLAVLQDYDYAAVLVAHGPITDHRALDMDNADLIVEGTPFECCGDGASFAIGDTDGNGIPNVVFGYDAVDDGPIADAGRVWSIDGSQTGHLISPDSEAQLVIVPVTDYASIGGWVRLADLNADGLPDIITSARAFPGDLWGQISFENDWFVEVTVGEALLHDCNGDGLDDFYTATGVVFGAASGTIAEDSPGIDFVNDDPELAYVDEWDMGGTQDAATSVAIGNLDGNGVPDLVWGISYAGPGGWNNAGAVLIFLDRGESR